MSRRSTTKTYVVCRPGMKQQAQAAFAGMDVEVDDTLTADYEFRQRDLDFSELLEAELEETERMEADPKNAFTFLIPMATTVDGASDEWDKVDYLAVRVERAGSRLDIETKLRALQPEITGTFPDFEVNVPATISLIRATLKKDGFNVLSVSEAEGLTLLTDR